MDNTRVFNMDCMKGMKEFPDKHFDLAIVDPPYGIDIKAPGRRANRITNYKCSTWDSMIPDYQYFMELLRVSVNQIIFGANYFTSFLPPSKGWIVFDKPQPDGVSFAQAELAYSSFDTSIKRFQGKRAEIGNCVSNNYKIAFANSKIHPTQKPINLYRWLLKNYAKEGDKILDTHGGSMSSVIACLDMGFPITCFELDTDYYNAGKNRIINHVKQLNAFRPAYDIEFHDSTGISKLRDQQGVGYQEQKNGENNKPVHRIDGLFHGDPS